MHPASKLAVELAAPVDAAGSQRPGRVSPARSIPAVPVHADVASSGAASGYSMASMACGTVELLPRAGVLLQPQVAEQCVAPAAPLASGYSPAPLDSEQTRAQARSVASAAPPTPSRATSPLAPASASPSAPTSRPAAAAPATSPLIASADGPIAPVVPLLDPSASVPVATAQSYSPGSVQSRGPTPPSAASSVSAGYSTPKSLGQPTVLLAPLGPSASPPPQPAVYETPCALPPALPRSVSAKPAPHRAPRSLSTSPAPAAPEPRWMLPRLWPRVPSDSPARAAAASESPRARPWLPLGRSSRPAGHTEVHPLRLMAAFPDIQTAETSGQHEWDSGPAAAALACPGPPAALLRGRSPYPSQSLQQAPATRSLKPGPWPFQCPALVSGALESLPQAPPGAAGPVAELVRQPEETHSPAPCESLAVDPIAAPPEELLADDYGFSEDAGGIAEDCVEPSAGPLPSELGQRDAPVESHERFAEHLMACRLHEPAAAEEAASVDGRAGGAPLAPKPQKSESMAAPAEGAVSGAPRHHRASQSRTLAEHTQSTPSASFVQSPRTQGVEQTLEPSARVLANAAFQAPESEVRGRSAITRAAQSVPEAATVRSKPVGAPGNGNSLRSPLADRNFMPLPVLPQRPLIQRGRGGPPLPVAGSSIIRSLPSPAP